MQIPRNTINARYVRRRTKLFFLGLIAWAMLMTLLVVIVSSTVSSYKTQIQKLESKPLPKPPATYSGFAQAVAVDYLEAKTVQVPVASGVPTNLGRVVTNSLGANVPAAPIPYVAVSFDTSQVLKNPYRVLDQFLVLSSGSSYWLTVPLGVQNNSPYLANLPTLAPAILPGTSETQLNWSTTYPQAQLSSGATSQVDAWADAYASNDQQTLYQLTGDTTAHTYRGLGGWQVNGTPQVVSATTRGTEAMIEVQVPLQLVRNSAVSITDTFDLLMQDISRPLPPIVAWGPAGSGWSLKPYQNALPGTPPAASGS